ncbi:MAG: Na+/H+ antiporter subunit E [Caryophanon sp.]|mgnify:FL=1|nr:Na+/H+ antiporter subunit E [Caryophanon sp.]
MVQFILNLFIALLWVLLKDEDYFKVSTFIAGYLVGIVILYIMHRFYGTRFYLRRVWCMISLIWLFIAELLSSSVSVMRQVVTPNLNIKPGIFTYETSLTSDWEITALALLLTLTPGSVVMEVSEEGNVFYIHAMDMEETKDQVLRSIARFERAILEVTR